jgi:hypothetical protein
MFITFDVLMLTTEGAGYFGDKYDIDDEFIVSMLLMGDDLPRHHYVVTNLTTFKAHEPIQPLMLNVVEVHQLFAYKQQHGGYAITYCRPVEMEYDDETLLSQHPNWYTKRKCDYEIIEPFTSDIQVWKYLSRHLGKDIKARAVELGINHKAIRRPLNRFISMGGDKHALTSSNYKNVGQAERHYKIKPGPKTSSHGLTVLSTSPVITPEMKQQIRQFILSNGFDNVEGNFKYQKAFQLFLSKHHKKLRQVTKNSVTHFEEYCDEHEHLNINQFRRAANNVLSSKELQIAIKGEKIYENSRRDKTGDAKEGLYLTALNCEVDTTPLPFYLASILDETKRLAAGKAYLCLVISIHTHLILGYSLYFAPPQWWNVMEAFINCMTNKQSHCAQYGVSIEEEEWPSQHLPVMGRLDNGPENPIEIQNQIIAANIGIKNFEICGPGEPSMKGTVEGVLNIIESMLTDLGISGTVVKGADGSQQHASQRALLTMPQMRTLLVRAIKAHNTTAARPELLSREMAMDNTAITPSALYRHMVNQPFYGRPKVSPNELPIKTWKMLPKLQASITNKFIECQGLKYSSKWAENLGWFERSALQGASKIQVVMMNSMVDKLYFLDNTNTLQEFDLSTKHVQFAGMTLDEAKKRLRSINEETHELKGKRLNEVMQLQAESERLHEASEARLNQAPLNHQKSIQNNLKDQNKASITAEAQERAKAHMLTLQAMMENENEFLQDETTPKFDDGDIS